MADLGKMFGAAASEGFLGLPRVGIEAARGARVAILGAGAVTSYPSVGAYCANGPAAIRAGGAAYAANLAHMNFDLGAPTLPHDGAAVDCGDLATVDGAGAENRALVRDAVAQLLDQDVVPLLLGGDDSLPIPMLEAFAGRGRYTILQIDAHIDWRDAVEGERLGLSSTMRRASEMGHVERIIQVGQRGIGSARAQDYRDACDWGVQFVPAAEVARRGVQAALDLIPEGAEVIICFDCDAIDPAIMPAVIGRTAGGLSYWQALDLIAGVAARARIAAFDLVEFMPERDIDGQSALVAAQLIAATLGVIARQG
ncbi:arginase family protein [Plastorhodobacter daqingensis]|uniref:Arginase family protein n=1 Tax=Plastorhodobacter daqingensis TaxID=1387281 RepID=A0ABW2UN92_9RHOB